MKINMQHPRNNIDCLGGLIISTFLPVSRGIVFNRFRHAKEEKASTDTTAKQHGKPGGVVVFRYTVILNNFEVKS